MKILITGKPGSGKSTLVKETIEKLDRNISGILSPEIREGRKRKGFKIIDYYTGKEEILASVNIKQGPKIGKYTVNISGINKIVEIFKENWNKTDLVIVDELGPMELKSRKFQKLINEIFQSDKDILCIIHRNLVNKYKKYGKIYKIEKNNFEEVKKEIINLLGIL